MRKIVTAVVGVALFAAGSILPISAAPRVTVSVEIAPTATLVAGGGAVDIAIGVACTPPRARALEAFVYITQDGNQSQFAAIPVDCSRRTRWTIVRVSALDFTFHRGAANASAYVAVTDPKTGTMAFTSPARSITIV